MRVLNKHFALIAIQRVPEARKQEKVLLDGNILTEDA